MQVCKCSTRTTSPDVCRLGLLRITRWNLLDHETLLGLVCSDTTGHLSFYEEIWLNKTIPRNHMRCTTDSHTWFHIFMFRLSSAIFESDPQDSAHLKHAKECELKQKIINPTSSRVFIITLTHNFEYNLSIFHEQLVGKKNPIVLLQFVHSSKTFCA